MAPANFSWSHPRVLTVLALIFVSGTLTGVVAMKAAGYTRYGKSTVVSAPPRPDITVDKLTRELDLSPAQAAQIKVIVEDFATYYMELQSQMADVRANGKGRILNVLNDKQKQKFERLYSEGSAKQAR